MDFMEEKLAAPFFLKHFSLIVRISFSDTSQLQPSVRLKLHIIDISFEILQKADPISWTVTFSWVWWTQLVHWGLRSLVFMPVQSTWFNESRLQLALRSCCYAQLSKHVLCNFGLSNINICHKPLWCCFLWSVLNHAKRPQEDYRTAN